jgi:LacI family repressor for deo operon, udp, cdd, tsx, nupC, and nupG
MALASSAEVNMADVARRAGVSIATVSRALRDVEGVNEGTRDRIKAVAKELSYVVSPEASRLARGPKGRVAVVVPKIDSWFYSTMLASIERVLFDAELDVLVYQVDGEEQRTRFFRDLPSRRKVDAVVMIALPLLTREVRRLDLLGVQLVVAGGRLSDFPHVEVNDYEVGRKAVGHLLDLGHRRIAMIRTSGTEGVAWSPDVQRTQAYRDALTEAGIRVREDYVTTQPFGVEAGTEGADALLALAPRPTAVFCYSDEIAIGAVQRLRKRDVDVPGEVSVIGVDDHQLAEAVGLTTVHQDVAAQGRLSGEMTLALLRGEPVEATSLVVPTQLLVRSTTAPPPRAEDGDGDEA